MNQTVAQLAWSAHDTRLILACLAGLALIVVLIAWLRIVPFLAILAGAFAAGAIVAAPMEAVAKGFMKGAGGLLGDVGIVIALGAMLGALLSASGAAGRLVDALLARATARSLPWLMAGVAVVIGLPLFFEVGLVLMVPIIFVMAERARQPVMRIAIPALAGMTTLHALLPPHPGPLIAVSALHADLGLTLALGLVAAIPAVICAGPLYGMWLAPRMRSLSTDSIGHSIVEQHAEVQAPGVAVALSTLLLPVVLMLGRTFARLALPHGSAAYESLDLIGEPLIALAITVAYAIVMLGWRTGLGRARTGETLRRSIAPIAVLLLTIGAGGGLKQVLVSAGISATIAKVALGTHLPLIVLAYLIAIALRQATGSATVATTTTAGILAPLVTGAAATESSLLALAIGAGSVFFCHVNDAGFWMIKEFFGLDLRETVKVWSVLQTIVSVIGFATTMLLWLVLV